MVDRRAPTASPETLASEIKDLLFQNISDIVRTNKQLAMNQLERFSQHMNDRHIGYKGPVTEKMLEQLVAACVHSSIRYNRVPTHTIFDIVYWVSNATTTHCDDNGIVDMEWKSGLMDWYWFVYLPWEQFLELVQGTHEFKDQPYYDQLLADYDKPFKENDIANSQMQMESLFDAKLYAVIQ